MDNQTPQPGDAPAEVLITTLAARPEYIDATYEMADTWPEFMTHGAVANALFWQVAPGCPQLCIVATHDGRQVGRGRAIPFAGHIEERDGKLPPDGWDRVLSWGMKDRILGRNPDTVSALEVALDPAYVGQGLSGRILTAMRDAARVEGYAELVAPVRPNQKHLHPRMPTAEYACLTREDGLPRDAWLRVHVRAGGVIDRVAPTSMLIGGSLAQWRSWTGLPFDRGGDVEVPGALVPVHCDPAHDYAVYAEPNVWVRHRLG